MIQQRLRTKIFIVVPILLFFSAYGIFSYNLDQMPLGGDEQVYHYPTFVNYFGLILQGDLFNECWKDKIFCEDPDRLSGLKIKIERWKYPPQLPPILLVGTSVELFGNNDDPASSYENLTAARLVSPVLGALMVVFVFILVNYFLTGLLVFHSHYLCYFTA